MNQGIIAIGAHPDDIELGCGASLAKLSQEGFDIFAVVLSSGSKGNPFDQNRLQETSQALNLLGVTKTFFLNFEDTKLALNLHEIIITLENIFSVHDKFHRTLILSGFCFLKIAKISLNSSFFPKPIKR